MNKQSKENKISESIILQILRILILSYALTAVLLFILAGIVYKTDITEKLVSLSFIFIYIISTFAAGYLCGRQMPTRKIVFGFIVGFTYFAIMLICSLLLNKGTPSSDNKAVTTFLLCSLSSTAGSVVAAARH